ncbi:glycosyltransferase family 4 protein [Streptomyces niger]|uniref:glycosyltransferase family 4 protein n=1 Tax=Streptomyces niger TaxID=66373 RepID=UPI00069A7438|nr:glycosyltransferase family 4 protein [Streptomyces niger]
MDIILTVSGQAWGGEQRYLLDVAGGLAVSGHAVTVLAEEGGAMLEACRQAGLPVVGLPPCADQPQQAVTAAVHVLEAGDAHVVCTTGRSDAQVVRQALARIKGKQAFALFSPSVHPLGTADEVRDLMADVHLVFAMSDEQRERQFAPLIAAGLLADDQVELVTNAVGDDFLHALGTADRKVARAALGLSDNCFAFLALGRLTWDGDVGQVIDAVGAMDASRRASVRVVVAGHGPMAEELRAHAEEQGVGHLISFPGHRADVAELIVACDAAVLTTTVPETGPLALKEAMAAGLPVLASAQGGIPEFVEDERHGLLVVDEVDLREAMEQLVAEPAAAAAMGNAARESILAGHRVAQRVEYLVHRFDLLALARLPLGPVLSELAWQNVRLRAEAAGGFVFVPRTSQLMELDAEAFTVVRAAVTARDPLLLLDAENRVPRRLMTDLYAMGALVRPSTLSEDTSGPAVLA